METYYGKKCDICNKGVQYANLVSHAKNRVKTIRKPNLHSHKMKVDGENIKLNLCAKCKREMNAADKVAKK